MLEGPVEHRQRLQAQKVEFHQSSAFDPLHIVLGRWQLGPGVLIERRQFRQGPVADHDARGVGGGVAEQTLKMQSRLQEARDAVVVPTRLLQTRLQFNRLSEGHRIGGIVRHHLGQAVNHAQRQLHDPSNVPQHSPCLQCSEGDDLRDAIDPVALLDVGDHLFTALLTEIDIEVGHRHPLRVQEAFEQEAKAQWVEIGDGERIGHQRSRTRATARSHRNAMRLGPLDEVRNDQEVAGKPHRSNDRQFPLQPRVILLLRRREFPSLQALLQTLPRLMRQFLDFGPPLTRREAGQDRVALGHEEGAPPGDLDGVITGLRQVGEGLPHFRSSLEAVLDGHPATFVLPEEGAVGNAQKRVVRTVHLRGREIDIVRRHQRRAVLISVAHQKRFRRRLMRQSVALQLHIKPVAEHRLHLRKGGKAFSLAPRYKQRIDGAVGTAGQKDEPLAARDDVFPGHASLGLHRRGDKGMRRQRHEVQPSCLGLGDQGDRRRPRPTLLPPCADPRHRQRAPDQGLNALVLKDLGNFERTEEICAIRQTHRRHVIRQRKAGEIIGLDRPFEERIGGADP